MSDHPECNVPPVTHIQPLQREGLHLRPTLAKQQGTACTRVTRRERHKCTTMSNPSEPGSEELANVLDPLKGPDSLKRKRAQL